MVEDKGNGFYLWDGVIYKSDIVRACIRPKVKAIGKLIPQHIRNSKEGFTVNPEPYIKFLYVKPTILTKLEIKAKFRAKQASFCEMQNLKT